MISVERTHHSHNSSVGTCVIDTFILGRHCQNIFNVNLKYLSLGAFLFLLFSLLIYTLSPEPESVSYLRKAESASPRTGLSSQAGSGHRPGWHSFRWGEHEAVILKKTHSRKRQPCMAFAMDLVSGKNYIWVLKPFQRLISLLDPSEGVRRDHKGLKSACQPLPRSNTAAV